MPEPNPALDGRLRLLFVAEAFGGGMFEITRMQAEGLARRGNKVAIAYGRRLETPADIRERIDESVELIPLPWTSRTMGAQARAQKGFRALIREWQPDVIHLMSSFAGLHGALATGRIPTVYTPQGYAFTMSTASKYKRWLYLLVESFVASRVSVVGACSLSEGEQARSLPGTDAVVVVPNGIDELNPGSGAVPRAHRSSMVVGAGRPLPQRRPEACARILSSVSNLGHVKWIGGGKSDSPGAVALRDAGIEMTGWVPRDRTLQELSQSTIYLHWTAWDGLPLSILEAMALDVIVVASDIGPNREVLGPAQVCATENEAVQLIRNLADSDDLRRQFLASQRERRKGYGSSEMVARWSQVYHRLVFA